MNLGLVGNLKFNMNLDDNIIRKIGQFLNLEKIVVRKKVELLLFKNENENNQEFDEKVEALREKFKDVIFTIVEKGELTNVENKLSGASGINGST